MKEKSKPAECVEHAKHPRLVACWVSYSVNCEQMIAVVCDTIVELEE